MDDESTNQPEEEEVEGHSRPHTGPDEVGKRFDREEESSEEDEVEGHRWPRTANPSEPEKRF